MKKYMERAVIGWVLLFSSCAGWIYEGEGEEGEWNTHIDARSYADWIYIRFSSRDTIRKKYNETAPAAWDFAIHRYDCKTNGGAVSETSCRTLEELKVAGKLPEGEFAADVNGKIAVDMSGMMEGKIVYADSPLNEVLGRWLQVDTGQMPPVYTPSKRVYLLRLADGTYAAVLFTDFSDEAGVKGYISFDYIYPLPVNEDDV